MPYTAINMVASVDGETAVYGRASGIGSRADREAMRALRSKVDAVMVGAGTLRAEKLNLGLDDPMATQPLAVVAGGSGELPLEDNLITRDQAVLVVLPEGPRHTEPDVGRAEVLISPPTDAGVSGPGGLNLRWLLGHLKGARGVERLLVEGGPSLNRALFSQKLVQELFLTVSPILLASGGPAILSRNTNPLQTPLDLLSVHAADHDLFLRYRVANH